VKVQPANEIPTMKDEDEIQIPKELEDDEVLPPPIKEEKPKGAEKPKTKEVKKFRSLNNLP